MSALAEVAARPEVSYDNPVGFAGETGEPAGNSACDRPQHHVPLGHMDKPGYPLTSTR